MRVAALFPLLCALAAPAIAQDVPAVAFEQLTIATSSVSLAATTVNPSGKPAAQYCSGILETADVRVRVDGTAPTASVGQFVPVGAVVRLRGADTIRRFAAIRAGATSGALGLTCYGSSVGSGPSVEVLPAVAGASTTGTGAEVHAATPSLTDVTIAAGTLSGTFTGAPAFTGNLSFSGDPAISGTLHVRESFDEPLMVFEEDMTAKVLTDAGINLVLGSPIGLITYREEQAKTASSWVQTAGYLAIAGDDTTDNEGVEIYLGDHGNTAMGRIKAGTTGACFAASITITDISGTDQLVIGWRKNEDFAGDNIYSGYADWAVVGINNVDGSIFADHEIAGGAGALSDDSGVNAADGGTYLLKSCISAAGVHSAYYTTNGSSTYVPITMTNGATAQTAAIYMNPFISFLVAGTDGPTPIINWIEITPLP
jgi:hypothetical protein